jgi:hypothetical protein
VPITASGAITNHHTLERFKADPVLQPVPTFTGIADQQIGNPLTSRITAN